MIALDSSALVAIALDEHDSTLLADVVANNRCMIGWPTVLELRMVLLDRAGEAGSRFVDIVLGRPNVSPVDFGHAHFECAAEAFARYGRGRHPAKLNFGDCMTYAVAAVADAPLLFIGDDFAQTDIASALA